MSTSWSSTFASFRTPKARSSPLYKRPPPGHFSRTLGFAGSDQSTPASLSGSKKKTKKSPAKKSPSRSSPASSTVSIEDYEADMLACVDEIDSLKIQSKKRIDALRAKLKSKDIALTKAKKEANFKSNEIAKCLNLLSEATTKLMSRETECNSLKNLVKNMKKTIARERQYKEEARDIPQSVGSEVDLDPSAHSTEKADQEHIDELYPVKRVTAEEKLETLKAEFLHLREEFESRNEALKTANSALEEELQRARFEKEEAVVALKGELETAKGARAADEGELAKELATSKEALLTSQSALAHANVEISRLEKESAVLKESLSKATSELLEKRNELSRKASKNASAKKEISDLIQKVEDARKEARDARKRKKELEEENKRASMRIEALETDCKTAKSECEAMKLELSKKEVVLKERIKSLEKERDFALLDIDVPPPPGISQTSIKPPGVSNLPAPPPPPLPSPPPVPSTLATPAPKLDTKQLSDVSPPSKDSPKGPPPPPYFPGKHTQLGGAPPGIKSLRRLPSPKVRRSMKPKGNPHLLRLVSSVSAKVRNGYELVAQLKGSGSTRQMVSFFYINAIFMSIPRIGACFTLSKVHYVNQHKA